MTNRFDTIDLHLNSHPEQQHPTIPSQDLDAIEAEEHARSQARAQAELHEAESSKETKERLNNPTSSDKPPSYSVCTSTGAETHIRAQSQDEGESSTWADLPPPYSARASTPDAATQHADDGYNPVRMEGDDKKEGFREWWRRQRMDHLHLHGAAALIDAVGQGALYAAVFMLNSS